MWLFDKIFGKRQSVEPVSSKQFTEAGIRQKNDEFRIRFDQTKDLLAYSLENYNSIYCQCAYPRFQQLVSIDCSNTGNSFKCYDTDLLIDLCRSYFDIEKSELHNECKNEKWLCKKCGSIYEYGWSDFSIYVERQKLKLAELKVTLKGNLLISQFRYIWGLWGTLILQSKKLKMSLSRSLQTM